MNRCLRTLQAFASDLEQLFREIEALGPVVSVKAGPGGRTMGGRVELDDTRVNRLLMQVCVWSLCKSDGCGPAGWQARLPGAL